MILLVSIVLIDLYKLSLDVGFVTNEITGDVFLQRFSFSIDLNNSTQESIKTFVERYFLTPRHIEP